MRRFFVGGTRELKDLSYVKNPGDNMDPKLSKFYFETVTAGNVVLRINTMIQTRAGGGGSGGGDVGGSKWKKAIKKAGWVKGPPYKDDSPCLGTGEAEQ